MRCSLQLLSICGNITMQVCMQVEQAHLVLVM